LEAGHWQSLRPILWHMAAGFRMLCQMQQAVITLLAVDQIPNCMAT